MTFKELKNQIKQELKDQAQIIRRGKFLRKPKNRIDITDDDKKLFYYKAYGGGTWFSNWKVKEHSDDYRHKHIMYCNMFNGTPYDKIEQPRDDNGPSSHKLESYKKKWESLIDEEALRRCA